MSYFGRHAEAHADIMGVEVSEYSRSNEGSKILHGHETLEGAAKGTKPATETLMPGRLRAGISKPLTSTDTLRRNYGSTGSGGE